MIKRKQERIRKGKQERNKIEERKRRMREYAPDQSQKKKSRNNDHKQITILLNLKKGTLGRSQRGIHDTSITKENRLQKNTLS